MVSGRKKTGESTGPETPKLSEDGTEPAATAKVDHWFDQQLTHLYGEVADEPVPDEILALINKLKNPH